jgi:hypothetical protein
MSAQVGMMMSRDKEVKWKTANISKHPTASSLLEDMLYTFDELDAGFDRCLNATGHEAATVACPFNREQLNELRCALRFVLDVKAMAKEVATKPYTGGPSSWVSHIPHEDN